MKNYESPILIPISINVNESFSSYVNPCITVGANSGVGGQSAIFGIPCGDGTLVTAAVINVDFCYGNNQAPV